MSISRYSPDMELEKDPFFCSGCEAFGSGDYLGAAKMFKTAYEAAPAEEWRLMNYAASIRNAGYLDYSLCILEWLEQRYPEFLALSTLFNATKQAIDLILQNGNPCALLNVRRFRLHSGFPERSVLADKDFHGITISLCMIVRNEAANIKRAIDSVRLIADEMIVVDTGSDDGTPEIAESLGAKVYHFKWNDDFSEARNYSLKFAGKDWILVLDADETISHSDLFYILEYVHYNQEYWGFAFDQRDYFSRTGTLFGGISCENDPYEESKPYHSFKVQRICRLFKNSRQIYFTNPVYEIVEESIKINGGDFCYVDIPIHHYGRLVDNDRLSAKRKYYIDILKRHVATGVSNERKAISFENIARAYSFLGDHRIALRYLKLALRHVPDSDLIHADIGDNAALRGDHIEAVRWYEKAIALNNDRPEYYMMAARSYLAIGDFLKAKQMADSCLAISPNHPLAMQFMKSMEGVDDATC